MNANNSDLAQKIKAWRKKTEKVKAVPVEVNYRQAQYDILCLYARTIVSRVW